MRLINFEADFFEEWQSQSKIEKYACINFVLVILLSFHCYLSWFIPAALIKLSLLGSTFVSLYALNIPLKFSPYINRLAILVLAYTAIFTFPIFGHSFRLGYCVNDFALLLAILYPAEIYRNSYKLLRLIIFIVCICTIIVWLIHLLGIELPNYHLAHPSFRVNPAENYKIYGPCVSMFYGNGFLGIERCNGIFAEPGHFGIFLGFILAGNKFRFSNLLDYTFLIAGILTFSTAFFGILAIGLIYRVLQHEGLKILFRIMLIGFMLIPVALSNDLVYQATIGRVLGNRETISVGEMVEQRTLDSTKFRYEQLMNTDQKWFGVGESESYVVDRTILMQNTNWRGCVYRYGIIGMTVLIVMLYYITTLSDWKYALMAMALMALIMSHRVYMFANWGIWIIEFLMVQINSQILSAEIEE